MLAMLLLTRTIIFNKRRQGEVQELTTRDLRNAPKHEGSQEIDASLSYAERLLAKR